MLRLLLRVLRERPEVDGRGSVAVGFSGVVEAFCLNLFSSPPWSSSDESRLFFRAHLPGGLRAVSPCDGCSDPPGASPWSDAPVRLGSDVDLRFGSVVVPLLPGLSVVPCAGTTVSPRVGRTSPIAASPSVPDAGL